MGYLLLQPGTPMHDLAIQMGKIMDEEKYRLFIEDKQDFHINLTKISQKKIENLVVKCLKKIADKLDIGLDEVCLIKKGDHRHKSED